MENPTLSKPPLGEVVWEVRHQRAKTFSLVPGKMAASLQKLYPVAIETEIAGLGKLLEPPPEMGLLITHQFKSEDGDRLVQLGPAGLSVNWLKYPGYKEFRKALEHVAIEYLAALSPFTCTRLGLRYINRLPADSLGRLASKFEWPTIPDGTPRASANRQIFDFLEPPAEMGIVVGTAAASGVILDFDYSSAPGKQMAVEEMLKWADQGHERVYNAFRAMVTDNLFDAWR